VICRDVPYGEDRHCNPTMLPVFDKCIFRANMTDRRTAFVSKGMTVMNEMPDSLWAAAGRQF
jgi:hypothetical protein